jgi:hypothetical protein
MDASCLIQQTGKKFNFLKIIYNLQDLIGKVAKKIKYFGNF